MKEKPDVTYNYIEETRKAVKDYLTENQIEPKNFADRDEMFEKVYDDCWNEDSVTGNASGSFFCNREKARECVRGNEDLLATALEEYEGDYKRALTDPEYADVVIRCYVLSEAVGTIIQAYDEKAFGGDE